MNAIVAMPATFPVTAHTDFVQAGSVFVAIEGYADNGVNYIKKAIEKGARTIVVHHDTCLDEELSLLIKKQGVFLMRVANTRLALAQLSAAHAGSPAKNLRIIGITGTKGKTTTSFLLEHILRSAGHKTALISSAKNKILGHEFSSPLTTPQPDYLQQFLKVCADNEVEYVVMEVAAQALSLHRVEGIEFCGLIFTNFSHEHLEFYSTLDDYFAAKNLIFGMAQEGSPILVNGDDVRGKEILMRQKNSKAYGFGSAISDADYASTYISSPAQAIDLQVNHADVQEQFVCQTLFGAYNGYNVLAACSMALELRVSSGAIQQGLTSFTGVPGRLQQHVLPNGARSFIDYAHNPESFFALLSTLRLLTDNLIVIFGAGGGRDIHKRPVMGSIAVEIADTVIITTDNPRLEDPIAIADDITRGIAPQLQHKITRQLDRQKAIEHAYALSSHGSIIALLGKGPDEYQIIGTTKYYFSEKQILQQLI